MDYASRGICCMIMASVHRDLSPHHTSLYLPTKEIKNNVKYFKASTIVTSPATREATKSFLRNLFHFLVEVFPKQIRGRGPALAPNIRGKKLGCPNLWGKKRQFRTVQDPPPFLGQSAKKTYFIGYPIIFRYLLLSQAPFPQLPVFK